MNQESIVRVYESLCGHLVEPVEGVADAFAPGSECELWYDAVLASYSRLCRRLGAGAEDPDVEVIIDSMLKIQKALCLQMYRYGAILEHGAPAPDREAAD